MARELTRRLFVGGAVTAGLPFTARSYSRILGANDRIQIGEIGCGHRARGHRQMLKKSAATPRPTTPRTTAERTRRPRLPPARSRWS